MWRIFHSLSACAILALPAVGQVQLAELGKRHLPLDGDLMNAVALGDVDGDGDLDALIGRGILTGIPQNRLYLNDGNGHFTDATADRLPNDSDDTVAVALGDVDGDGDLDAVIGNGSPYTSGPGGQNRLYLNDGTGRFADATAARMPADADHSRAVALGDVDGDGDPDLVLGTYHGQNRLYLNNGKGQFTDATPKRMPASFEVTDAVALGDVDGDGDLDLVFGNDWQNSLYLNDGKGQFTDATATRLPTDTDTTRAVALGDVDGDGDLDLVFGNDWQNRLHLNLLRQLDSPFLVIPGGEYRLDAYARYGASRLVDVALPFVATGTARIPLPPFGTIGLDPTSMIPLPPIVIPRPAGMGSATAMVPRNPALLGRSIHAQALLLQWPGPAFLTNVTSDRFVR